MPEILLNILSGIQNLLLAGCGYYLFFFIAAVFYAFKDRDWDMLKQSFFAPSQILQEASDSDNDSTLSSLMRLYTKYLHPFFIVGYIVCTVYYAAISPVFSFLFLFATLSALGYYFSPNDLKVQLSINPKGRRHLNRLEAEISKILDMWEEKLNPMQQSAKPIIMEYLHSDFNQKEVLELAASWSNNFDYSFEAHKGIYQLAIRALTSGKYHLSYGVLNPMGPGPHLNGFVHLYLNWAVEQGYLTPEEKTDELSLLANQIAQVG